ncbi:MAG: substrate-binding domain-containing protein [Deltaproteobacteria bacterium]|nr:substrate-binding domain-containing protein [Deltaproteobacteria bacterium]
MNRFLLILLLAFGLQVAGCDSQQYPATKDTGRKEILIYCGMTMIKPIMELVASFEAQEKCNVKLTYGGSNHLLHSIETNQIGDLFFPGKESYVNTLSQSGVVTDSVTLGYNQAALFVQTGNPKNLTSTLSNLIDEHLHVVIGNDSSGSIGRETRRILEKAGIFQEVVDNALYLTTDSKGLVKAIKNKEADLVVNWQAVLYLDDNRKFMTLLPLPPVYVEKQPLVMGLLKFSRDKALARSFMRLAASPAGQDVFKRYGFRD